MMRACVRACVRTCVHACVRASSSTVCICVCVPKKVNCGAVTLNAVSPIHVMVMQA